MFADVIVDIAHSETDRIFEYSFEDSRIVAGSRVLVPFGKKNVEGIVINVKSSPVYDKERIRPVLDLLEETPAFSEETLALSRYVAETCFVSRALSFRLFLPSEMRKGRVRERFVAFAELNKDLNFEEITASLSKTAIRQKQAVSYLKENGKTKLSFLRETFGVSAVNAAIDKGFISVTEEKRLREPYKGLEEIACGVDLTEKQTEAVNSINDTDKTVSLIFGVTGSGKTEIYLNLIDGALKHGKTAIMLVPEIALTPQMLKQLRARFGSVAAILHSGLSAGERYDEWWRLRTGEAKIAIGARSAIFAPVEDVGIIIIDEEHDGSYVSESAPRYDTVDIALFRAKHNDAREVCDEPSSACLALITTY